MDIQERNAAIYAMSQGGMRQVDIAKRFGLVQSNISTIIKNEHAKAKSQVKKINVEPVKKVKDLIGIDSNKIREADMNYIRVAYKSGLTVNQMASALREPTWKVEGYLSQVKG